jgi:nitrous oxidase accessory protein
LPPSLKGNALKMWYLSNSTISNNTFVSTKNITFSYSNNNIINNNIFIDNMLALHFAKSNNNLIKNNMFKYNSVGIMIVGTKNNQILQNKIISSKGAAGIALVLDKTSNLLVKDNIIKYNAKAFYIDTKKAEYNYQRFIINNKILYNKEAFHFHSSIKNNVIVNNLIKGNIDDVVKDVRGTYTKNNKIEYNYWDRYTGFDTNKDNIGDTTHKNYQYTDQLWHYNPKLKFFYATPVMSMIDFLARLAPFIEPNLLLEDIKPLINETQIIHYNL